MSDIEDCRKFVENLTRDRGEVMHAGNDKIAEIRARQEEARTRLAYDAVSWQCERDRAFLLDEDARHRAEVERLRAALRWYADPRNHFPVERRSPGDPDPAVVFIERPPIMDDCGRRARKALEGEA